LENSEDRLAEVVEGTDAELHLGVRVYPVIFFAQIVVEHAFADGIFAEI